MRRGGLQIRFEESNVSAHHAEMGNLLSLNPKIHRLDADTQVDRSLTDCERKFFRSARNSRERLPARIGLGEELPHALLQGMFRIPPSELPLCQRVSFLRARNCFRISGLYS